MSFGSFTAVESTDLEIHNGDFFAILGPSGCGKSTLLRIIGGFLKPTSGRVRIAGVDVTALPPERRPTNMVFQSYGLFPHMTVRQNIAYGLRLARRPKEEIEQRVAEIIDLVHLRTAAENSATALSGGQQQRVALARALVMRPQVLLLDEPLAALDLKLRNAMHLELREIHRKIGGTFVLVSHDQGEVMSLATRVAVMQEGCIMQEGRPRDIYRAPATEFVSTFIGDANILIGYRRGGRVQLEAGPAFDDEGRDGAVTVMVRPENMRIGEADGKVELVLPARLVDTTFFGPYVMARLELSDGSGLSLRIADERTIAGVAPGDAVSVGWDRDDQKVIDR